MIATASDVLIFWFGVLPHESRAVWFRKDPDFDAAIRERFGDAVAAALGGAFSDWSASARGALARVILLDQFTRNIFRDTPRAFAGDTLALAIASAVVDAGGDRALDRYERQFLYMPFEHSESTVAQDRSVELFAALARETGDDSLMPWARRHAEIVHRFGRFPHRNAILGRASTPEETAFLEEPGSRF
jgi:uncharacterized protein (DUF924 family)